MFQKNNSDSLFTSREFLTQLFAFVFIFGSLMTPRVAAASSMPVAGWAWGGTDTGSLDWISFSSTNTGSGGGTYGVYEDSATGALSGYAWANTRGWITFEAAKVSGCPSAPCAPSVNLITGRLTGWARTCAAFADKNSCSGALEGGSGGWDGWIALSGTAADSVTYGITQDLATGAWTGYAWGSDATGAIGMTSGAGLGSLADLTPTTAVSPTAALAGTATTLSVTISNIGAGATGAGFTNLFQFDNNADHAAVTDTRTDTSPAVAAGGTDVSQVSYTFTADGTWYVRACVDNNTSFVGTVLESNESNNCGAWTPVEVALPILTGTFSASPDIIDPGNPSTLTWTSNATSCVGQGTFSTGVGSPANGSAVVAPTTPGPNSYQIICSKPGYSDLTLATTITVISVTASINAKPSCISGGGSSKVSWSASPESQIASCTISSNPTGPGFPITQSAPPFTGEHTAAVSDSKYTFIIACTTDGGATVTKSTTVDVRSCWTEF